MAEEKLVTSQGIEVSCENCRFHHWNANLSEETIQKQIAAGYNECSLMHYDSAWCDALKDAETFEANNLSSDALSKKLSELSESNKELQNRVDAAENKRGENFIKLTVITQKSGKDVFTEKYFAKSSIIQLERIAATETVSERTSVSYHIGNTTKTDTVAETIDSILALYK